MIVIGDTHIYFEGWLIYFTSNIILRDYEHSSFSTATTIIDYRPMRISLKIPIVALQVSAEFGCSSLVHYVCFYCFIFDNVQNFSALDYVQIVVEIPL